MTIKERFWQASTMLEEADLLFDEAACRAALERMAADITADLGEQYPLLLPVMGGAVVFTGQLLPLLRFPLDFDYVHVSRYGSELSGSAEFNWLRAPQNSVEGRHVLVLDDILDEGHTMAAIHRQVMDMGAASCRTAVFANKAINRPKPIEADYVGIHVPDRYVFGYGMDAAGMWRNLGAIYALANK
ncbi:hypoxanthine-guanine phosphoribosyltransferase [Eikenella sp. S3360]|uniref:Hypoxanthine-guanine phosphoribosyltransferase n=1 Tax=Eikenella glucosivorans TaxID=2766967 RepID=A0ABS0N8H1_9NEIS|nr:hypoxanthine-guanine phosphoribosyltransferase [Eikenella glucosivorans]MBH5328585.1 hypoxanthine-guanine phosphoribosyltransferase [Eikenella glucosivorans]